MAKHQGESCLINCTITEQKPGEIQHSQAGFATDESIDPKPASSLRCILATDYGGIGMKLDIG